MILTSRMKNNHLSCAGDVFILCVSKAIFFFMSVSKVILDTTKVRLIYKSINYRNALRSRSQEIIKYELGIQT